MSQPFESRRDILYFGNDWFAENRTSSHQIARCLARKHRVFYLECPGLRAPKGSARDLRKLFAKLWRFACGAQTVIVEAATDQEPEVALRVRTLFQIPFHRFAVVRWLNQWLLWLTIRWLMFRERIRQPIAWHMVPHLARIAGTLGEDVIVYYCIDDYASLPDVDSDSIRTMDEILTRKADIVFVASATLLEGKKQFNSNTHVSPHGVETAHFGLAQTLGEPLPADIRDLPRPIIGFFGLIERWIDLGLVGELARRRPDWSFLMLGRVAVPADELPQEPNIHFLGHRPYGQLPHYGRAFDVAIIPYHLTSQVLHANPIKLREYLAMGKPIVTVRTPEIEKFSDIVAIADTVCEFEARICEAYSPSSLAKEEVDRRLQRVANMSWDNVVARAWMIVSNFANSPVSGAVSHSPQSVGSEAARAQ